MKDLLKGKTIEDFEKALFSDHLKDQYIERYLLQSISEFCHLVIDDQYDLEQLRSGENSITCYKYMKPLPKPTPLSDEEIKEALLGEIVEGYSVNHDRVKGALGYSDTTITIGGRVSAFSSVKSFRNPSNRFEWLEVTRENFIKCGLMPKEGE